MLLVGLMGAGKSSVGQEISALTGWPAVDNDVLLERATGSTAAALLAEHGLERLRAAESAVLGEILAMPSPLVAGVPAGVVLDPRDRDRLRAGGHVVWLRAPVATLARRVAGASHRPAFGGDPLPGLQAMADERNAFYASVADQQLDMLELTPAQAARLVVTAVTA